MKSLPAFHLFLCFTLFFPSFMLGQIGIEWEKSFGSSSWDRAESILQTDDGGFLVLGYAATNDLDANEAGTGGDLWLIKLDQSGNLLWQRFLGGSDNDFGKSIRVAPDVNNRSAFSGGYIIAGGSGSSDGDVSANNGGLDAWVVKVDDQGNIQWEKNYGGTDSEWVNDIQATQDGGYIVVGNSQSSDGDLSENKGKQDFWVFKISGEGALLWEKSFGGSEAEGCRSVVVTPGGGYLLVGFTESLDGDLERTDIFSDCWVIKLDSEGNLLWKRTYGGSNVEDAYEIKAHPEGGYVLLGSAASVDGDVLSNDDVLRNGEYWIVRLSEEGNIMWENTFGGTNNERGNGLDLTEDGGYILTGYAFSNNGEVDGNHGRNDIWLVKLDEQGELEWQRPIGGTDEDEGIVVSQTPDGGYIAAGVNWSSDGDASGNNGQSDVWVIKLKTVTTSTQGDLQLPGLSLFPNPSPGPVRIEAEGVSAFDVEVFDAAGQSVYRHRAESNVDLDFLPNGIYWLRLKNKQSFTFKKLVIQK